MQYEDELLQECGRNIIPLERLRKCAITGLRKFQKKKIVQKTSDTEPILDDILLFELSTWFKNEYMTWFNKPKCSKCNFEAIQTGYDVEDQVRVEEYICCNTPIKFYRYNDVAMLLQTRKGRCGEFANLFTFFCRCLGYDARLVFCTEDHVWTEVYSHYQSKWIHIDPCENAINKPLMYEHGWKKEFKYVIGFSRDDVQDVTWRYSNMHKEVLKRRTLCTERQLLDTIISLRNKRQEHISKDRLAFINKRTLIELISFLNEGELEDNNMEGRSSGSLQWRQARKETK